MINTKARNVFSTSLLIFSGVLEEEYDESNQKLFLTQEFQQELYKWIDATGITAENCPNFLKSTIFEIHEVIKGSWQKILNDKENRKREIEIDDPKYLEKMNEVFEKIGPIQHQENQKAQKIVGKKWHEIEITTRFKGDAEVGKKTFQEIANSLVNHQDFYFVEQKDGKGKWKKEKAKTVQKNQTGKHEINQKTQFVWILGLTISGIIILLIGWMAIRKKKRNNRNQKSYGKI